MVRGSNVRDALPEVDIFPREAGRLAGPSTVPAEEEDEAQERWMLAPRELPLEGSAREPFGDLLPFFRCQRSGGWRVESFPPKPHERITQQKVLHHRVTEHRAQRPVDDAVDALLLERLAAAPRHMGTEPGLKELHVHGSNLSKREVGEDGVSQDVGPEVLPVVVEERRPDRPCLGLDPLAVKSADCEGNLVGLR